MLRIILLSLVWAICSTCLVRPWFWKGVKNKDLFNYKGKKIGFCNDNWKKELVYEVVIFVVTFVLSIVVYTSEGLRQSLYNSLVMITTCFLCQCIWDYQGKVRYIIMLTIAIVSAILWIQDDIVGNDISVPLTATQVDEDTVDFVSEPTYNNSKYIFTVSGGDNGKGIVVIDKDNYTEANFLPCSYGLNVTDIRPQYPTQKLKELYITISDDNVPYGLFAVAEKTWILGTYKVNSYIMFNLMTGEAEEFTQEELPNFVTNN